MDIVNHLRTVVAPHAQRLIDGHFGNDAPRPQISIPADEKSDTDLIVSRGIKAAADEIERLRGAVQDYGGYKGREWLKRHDTNEGQP